MTLKISIIVFLLCITYIKADDYQCSQCNCVVSSATSAFTRGETIGLCVQFITTDASGNINTQRAAFPIQVDQYTAVQLQGGQVQFQESPYVHLVVQPHGTVLSPALLMQSNNQSFYSNTFSVVIQISNGVIQTVTWDHQCSTCDYSSCFKYSLNGTYVDAICNNQTCYTGPGSPGCDPQIYVSWIGSDANGVKMTSAGMRFARFRDFSSSDLLAATTLLGPVTNSGTTSNTNTNTGGNTGTPVQETPTETIKK